MERSLDAQRGIMESGLGLSAANCGLTAFIGRFSNCFRTPKALVEKYPQNTNEPDRSFAINNNAKKRTRIEAELKPISY